ncbi:MAG: 7-carboxy-7-deazaguanine synthase QueE [Bacteroidales bacterium]|nr:7-carboxy-7-deazaguanine synthase QueE [Bacteroidales bacterium]OQC37957.1 MAG: 7-carboxy-7-deazaguanine synthase [Bacteroidetes bacterium ADurb.Bin041]HNV49952.1 7-carboxy-7-deazaguanine synthase QueE [Bacteroidales bacterium]HOF80382.1 7-carboxy-7-deazaguanine synthase QueE [Bacteroidales bacterium]HOG66805.1 7-carboxy-7-deazaguanine synthase QueE [Bacteroidales bacterium]
MLNPKFISYEQKRHFEEGKLLPVMEAFYTLQGEGYNTGEAAFFIRIGGCDVGCRWCDIKESWNPEIHPLTSTLQVVEQAAAYPSKAVVVTGGEPLMYNLNYLCAELKKNSIKTYLETSGAYPLSGQWDWICLSPKKNSAPIDSITSIANELKVIIFNDGDLTWAEKYANLVSNKCKLYLQPEWSRSKFMTPVIIEYIKKYPKWKISLQSHKFMNIP